MSPIQAVNIVLPSDDSSQSISFLEGSEQPTSSTMIPTYIIRDALDGFSHARNLLSTLVDVSMAASASCDATPAFQDYVGWLLDSFLVTHDLHKKWRTTPSLHPTCSEACAMPFCSVHALLNALGDFISPPLLRKGYTLLSIFCTDLLEDPTQMTERSVQTSLCSSIMNLAPVCRKYDSVRRSVSIHLLPVIRVSLTGENTIIGSLGNDLEVCKVRRALWTYTDIVIDSLCCPVQSMRARRTKRSQSESP